MQERNSGNYRQIISGVIAAACILVYVIALVQAAIRVYISVDQRRTVAEQEFFDVADLASSAGALGFMNETFTESITDALAAAGTLEALIISGPDGEYAFEREKGRGVNWVNNSPRFKNRLDFFSQPLYQPLRIAGLRNVNIQAVASAVDYRLVTGIMKQTLLMVLAALVLAFFTLLLESLLGKNLPHAPYQPAEDSAEESAGPASRRYSPEEFQPPPPAPQEESQTTTVAAETPAAPVTEAPAEAVSPPPVTQTQETPKGLYSPHGNIGWEAYTADRLESELHRCASSEQDLVFIVMEYKYSKALSGGFYNQFTEEAVRFFTNRDLIFEKGERGIAVVYPHADLETGFAKCDEFHSRILGKYPGAFPEKTDLCAGLSSRAGRLLDAKRLIFEASEALERALVDPVSHIVAFKSDPDKYRAFIASQKRRRP